MRLATLLSFICLSALFTSCEKSSSNIEEPPADTTRVLYAIKPNGDLGWYRHTGYFSGVPSWLNNGQFRQVGEDWHLMSKAFRAGNNILYAVKNNGTLGWYLHTGWQTGDRAGWANTGQFTPVHSASFAGYTHVFSGGGQIIYAVKPNGDLGWFRHTGQEYGTDNWANNGEFSKVGDGFQDYTHLFSPGNGIIYGVKADGKLYWLKHLGFSDGTDTWANGGLPVQVGEDWDRFSLIFSGGGNVIYAVLPNGRLGWYRHTGQAGGTPNWANNGQFVQVGEDWNVFVNAF